MTTLTLNAPQAAFRALADPTRREILVLLKSKPMTIAEVAQNFDMTRAAVKKHLVVLQDGDLIQMRRSGRETLSSLNPHALKPVVNWLNYFETFWDDRLSALHDTLSELETKE